MIISINEGEHLTKFNTFIIKAVRKLATEGKFLNLRKSIYQKNTINIIPRTSLAVQWLRFHASNAGGPGSIPGRGTKIPQATQQDQNITKFLKSKRSCL